jgi:hypothetical protein
VQQVDPGMKLFVLLDDLDDSGPLWLNTVAAEIAVLSQLFDVTLLQVPQPGPERDAFMFRARERLGRMAMRKEWVAKVRAAHDPKGPNLLLVWAGRGAICAGRMRFCQFGTYSRTGF